METASTQVMAALAVGINERVAKGLIDVVGLGVWDGATVEDFIGNMAQGRGDALEPDPPEAYLKD